MPTRDELVVRLDELLKESEQHRAAFQDAQEQYIAAYRKHEKARAELVTVTVVSTARTEKEYEWKLDQIWYQRPELVALTQAVDNLSTKQSREREEVERCITEINVIGMQLPHLMTFGGM